MCWFALPAGLEVKALLIISLFLLLFVAIVAVGQSLVMPSLSSLISRATPIAHQGSVLGVNQSGLALARTVGPAMAGILFDMNENFPFWMGGSLMFLAFIAALGLLRGEGRTVLPWGKR